MLITAEEGLGFSLALIDVTESEANYHEGRAEIYTVISGSVEVFINGKGPILHRGDVIAIPFKAVHWIKSTSNEKARVLVSCVPGWIPEDHHVVEILN